MKKYYRAHANINLDAINHNIKEIRKNINKDTKIMAVLKADGYGLGAVPIGQNIKDKVDFYGVSLVEEGIILRRGGIEQPILILGFTSHYQYEDVINNNISQTIYEYQMAVELSQVAVSLHKSVKVHIKIDTGMSRIGFFNNEETIDSINAIMKLPGIEVEGIFTHLACADEKDKTSANRQLDEFSKLINKLEAKNINIPIKHTSNSAGIIDLPQANLDIVRAGISIYGLYPSYDVDKDRIRLKPALELKSYVIQVKELPKGVCVSYGGTYITSRVTKVATIPLGYGDGYPRSLSSKGRVIIDGQSAPIIGRVCMDQFMVDVTDINNIKKGDMVTLVGVDGNECITVDDIAELTNTINYEFICDLGKRIPRVYYKNGEIVENVDYF